MAFNPDILSQGEIHALREAAERAWGDDTRHEAYEGAPLAAGQCYNTSRWLEHRLGGSVGYKDGHYFWLSPDESHALDLTADQFGGHPMSYKPTSHHLFAGYQVATPHDDERDAGNNTERFIRRANREYEQLDDPLTKLALDYAGDAYPAEMPQQANDIANRYDRYHHHDPPREPSKGEYYFIFANGQIEASPFHDHEELAQQAGISLDDTGPLAVGYISVDINMAHWSVQSNIGAKTLAKKLKDYTKKVGWNWGGMTDLEGEPVGTGSEFAPKKTTKKLRFTYAGGKLIIGRRDIDLLRQAAAEDPESLPSRLAGQAEEDGDVLRLTALYKGPRFFISKDRASLQGLISSLQEYCEDRGLTLVGGFPGDGWADAKGGVGDNVIKRIEDLELKNLYDPNPKEEGGQFFHEPDQREPGGVYRCPNCGRLSATFRAHLLHKKEHEGLDEEPEPDENFPEIDMDATFPTHFTEQKPEIMPMAKTADVPPPQERPTEPFMVGTKILYDDGDGTKFTGVVTDAEEGYEDEETGGMDANVSVKRDDTGKGTVIFMSNPFLRAADPEPEFYQHPDPWMDNEPGTLTFPKHWGGTILPVASVAEARRVDGFRTYAKTFDFDDDNHRHYVAFENGCPVGFATVSPSGVLKHVQANRPVTHHIMNRVLRDYGELTVEGGNFTDEWLKHARFTQVSTERWRYAKDQAPTDMLEAELPFIYDVQKDEIHIGDPGNKTSDIIGPFTPGGIVEGVYEPGGKVYLNTDTNIPYTVRHLVDLWYWTHPELEVKGVIKRDGEGNEKKLAAELPTDIGTDIRTLVAADPAASSAARALMQAGGNVFAVGGAVRDAVMGKTPKDIDLMVQGLDPKHVQTALGKLPGRVDFTGKDFGVFRLKMHGHDVEVALPRRERSTGDAHKDFDVQSDHTMKPEEDLYRRDFTANAMAVNLATGELRDPYGGAGDIAANRLKTVHEHALAEDPLRTVRALVARGRHGLEPDEGTRAQMAVHGSKLKELPPERIQAELDKIMRSPDPAAAIRLAHETGVLEHILPEVEDAMGYDQNNPHHEQKLGDHLLSVLDRAAKLNDDPDVRLAALLHDIGKPGSAWVDPETGKNHFYRSADGQGADHETLGAEMAQARLEALRYPKDRIKRVTELVQHHMFPWWTTAKGARKFVNKVGDHADDLMDIREADNGGKTPKYDPRGNLPTINKPRELLDQVRSAGEPTTTAQLAINGHDLTNLGLQGPAVGAELRRLTDLVVDDPNLNDRDTLLGLVQR